MAGRPGTPRLAYQFLITLVAVPLVTATAKTAVAYPGTGLGFSGVVFAMAGILTVTIIQAAPKDRLAGVLVLAAVPLLVPPVGALPDGRIFYTDVGGHWCGFVVGCGTALVYPLTETRREWIGVLALAYFAAGALPMGV
jgi:membrane associated rhomboid family serine protease